MPNLISLGGAHVREVVSGYENKSYIDSEKMDYVIRQNVKMRLDKFIEKSDCAQCLFCKYRKDDTKIEEHILTQTKFITSSAKCSLDVCHLMKEKYYLERSFNTHEAIDDAEKYLKLRVKILNSKDDLNEVIEKLKQDNLEDTW